MRRLSILSSGGRPTHDVVALASMLLAALTTDAIGVRAMCGAFPQREGFQ